MILPSQGSVYRQGAIAEYAREDGGQDGDVEEVIGDSVISMAGRV